MIKSYKIFCDKCKKIITKVEIYPNGENKEDVRPSLKLSGVGWICSTISYRYTKETLLRIAKLIEKNKFREVGQIVYDTFGFFCFRCGKSYCAGCWTDIIPIFDSYYYDYTLATCPFGHRQEIND